MSREDWGKNMEARLKIRTDSLKTQEREEREKRETRTLKRGVG